MSNIIFKPSVFAYFLFPFIGLFFGGPSGAWNFSVLGVSLFINVLLHEYGHWYMAKKYNNKYCYMTIGITGGSTSYSGVMMSSRQLARVILAGPLMNILIGFIALLFWGPSSILAQTSFCLAAFNLLPIGKLDGGQLTRIVLGRYFDDPRKLCSVISVITAMAVVAYLYFNFSPFIALVGIYFVGYLFARKDW